MQGQGFPGSGQSSAKLVIPDVRKSNSAYVSIILLYLIKQKTEKKLPLYVRKTMGKIKILQFLPFQKKKFMS